jgi:hypothetical protein
MKSTACAFCIVTMLTIFLGSRVGSSEDTVIFSTISGECHLTVEQDSERRHLRLRAHHPKYRDCRVTRDEMVSALERAFSRIDSGGVEADHSSLFLGRLIDYPWMSQYLATTAHRDPGWNSSKGKPEGMGINQYVARLLFRQELMDQIEGVFEHARRRVTGVMVEKVLVARLRDVPLYRGDITPGKVPYDAQVWLTLARNR